MKTKKESFFWTSYSDLMTSLFFVMLVLFVLTVAVLNKQVNATKTELNKIKEVENATKNINTTYFEYNNAYRKHILKVKVYFKPLQANMTNLKTLTRDSLINAGNILANYMKQHHETQYLLIIEGQASRDYYRYNYPLSYQRSLALMKFWYHNSIYFGKNCEVQIAGSGDGYFPGTDLMRKTNEIENQRFLIHIIPKIGEIIDKSRI